MKQSRVGGRFSLRAELCCGNCGEPIAGKPADAFLCGACDREARWLALQTACLLRSTDPVLANLLVVVGADDGRRF